jgi:hypothetical protein
VAVYLITQLFLNLIGLAFGAASLAPLSGGATAASLTTGAGIWFAISSILSALAGGYAAGKFAGPQRDTTAGWHGLTAWALATLLLSYLVTSAAGGLLGGLGGGMKSAAQIAAPGLTQMIDPFSSIEQSVRSAASGNDPTISREAAIAELRTAFTGNPAQASEARERAAQALARAENTSVENARSQVQRYEQQYRQVADQTKQQAARTADETAKALSRAALLGAITLLLSGIAAWLGGRMAAGDQSFTSRLAEASGRASGRTRR